MKAPHTFGNGDHLRITSDFTTQECRGGSRCNLKSGETGKVSTFYEEDSHGGAEMCFRRDINKKTVMIYEKNFACLEQIACASGLQQSTVR